MSGNAAKHSRCSNRPGGHPYPANSTKLMKSGVSSGARDLTPDDCVKARTKAREFSERFKQFNYKRGEAPPPTLGSPSEFCVNCSNFDSFATSRVCCDLAGEATLTTRQLCVIFEGTEIINALECTPDPPRCCVTSTSPPDADSVPRSQCEALGATNPALGAILDDSQCQELCCNEMGNQITRYQCEQTGGTEVGCVPE